MRTFAHLSAMLLALPQVLLATAFLLLGHVTGTKTLGGLLTRILDVFVAAFTWGGLAALLVFAALALSAVFDRTRSFAAIAVALFVITSTIALLATVPLEWADAWLFVPGAASLALCRYVAKTPVSSGEPNAWTVVSTWKPDRKSAADVGFPEKRSFFESPNCQLSTL